MEVLGVNYMYSIHLVIHSYQLSDIHLKTFIRLFENILKNF